MSHGFLPASCSYHPERKGEGFQSQLCSTIPGDHRTVALNLGSSTMSSEGSIYLVDILTNWHPTRHLGHSHLCAEALISWVFTLLFCFCIFAGTGRPPMAIQECCHSNHSFCSLFPPTPRQLKISKINELIIGS